MTLRRYVSFFPHDPALMLVMCIQCCTPSAYNLVSCQRGHGQPGVIKLPISGESNNANVYLEGFPLYWCIVWIGDRMTPCQRQQKHNKSDPPLDVLKVIS